MAKPATFDALLAIRLPRKDLRGLKNHCRKKLNRNHQDVIREIIVAMNEGRLTITATEDQKNAMGELYK